MKILLSLCGLFLSFVLYANYEVRWSPEARRGYLNQQIIKRVKPGMSVPQVKAILGAPLDSSRLVSQPARLIFQYQVPPGSSASCQVHFDHNRRVIDAAYVQP